jgi:hypothetical protein
VKRIAWSIAVLCLSLLNGCSTTPLTPQTVRPQADLLQPCPLIASRPLADLGELLLWTRDLVAQYGECAARQRALADAVR